ncbi:MAG TPA: UDP-3-O-(3-hydroxymyristoyl)glucosamine N-acyltransferase [Planctomycetota bacterium]|nr:UDP-3-O-(3-hydroxymyristoyl)glucosamine N-acyltransferase [Planctomycetota bacterium]
MSFRFTASQVQAFFGGELQGDPDAVIERFSPIEDAGPGSITFIWNKKYYTALKTTKATLVLVPEDIDRSWTPPGVTILVHENPYLVLAKGMQLVYQEPRPSLGVSERAHVAATARLGADCNVHPLAYVGEDAVLGDRVTVHPFAYVGHGCVVGDDTVLHPSSVVYPKCRVGARCIVHAGAVVGSDGFGFATDKKRGEHVKIPQVGIVVLEDDVEVGASTTIDRAAFGETRIGSGTKIDNLVQIAHNVRVGRGCLLVAQSGIAGTTRLGDFVTVAAQAGLVGHLDIGSNVQIAAQSGVVDDVKDGAQVIGSPAVEGKQGLRYHLVLRHLPEMYATLRKLERRVRELEAKSSEEKT